MTIGSTHLTLCQVSVSFRSRSSLLYVFFKHGLKDLKVSKSNITIDQLAWSSPLFGLDLTPYKGRPQNAGQVPIMLLPKPLILLYQHNQTKKAQDWQGFPTMHCSSIWQIGRVRHLYTSICYIYIYALLYVSSVSMPADVAAVYSVSDLGFAWCRTDVEFSINVLLPVSSASSKMMFYLMSLVWCVFFPDL